MIAFERKNLAELAGCHDWVVLDTETTGLGGDDKIICVAAVAVNGERLFQSPVRPTVPIHPKASAVNGLTDEMVADAAVFTDVYPRLTESYQTTVPDFFKLRFRVLSKLLVTSVIRLWVTNDKFDRDDRAYVTACLPQTPTTGIGSWLLWCCDCIGFREGPKIEAVAVFLLNHI